MNTEWTISICPNCHSNNIAQESDEDATYCYDCKFKFPEPLKVYVIRYEDIDKAIEHHRKILLEIKETCEYTHPRDATVTYADAVASIEHLVKETLHNS